MRPAGLFHQRAGLKASRWKWCAPVLLVIGGVLQRECQEGLHTGKCRKTGDFSNGTHQFGCAACTCELAMSYRIRYDREPIRYAIRAGNGEGILESSVNHLLLHLESPLGINGIQDSQRGHPEAPPKELFFLP